MYKIGERFILVDGGEELEVEIINIDKEDEKYPYECYPMSVVREAQKLVDVCEDCDNYREVILFSDYRDDMVEERICLSEIDIKDCKHKMSETKRNKEVDFYKNALTSLIDSVLDRLEECPEDKLWIFENSGIDSEDFKKLGYDSIACQLEDAGAK